MDVLIDSNDAVIARTIANLAQSMKLIVVAEGVETAGNAIFCWAVVVASFNAISLFARGP